MKKYQAEVFCCAHLSIIRFIMLHQVLNSHDMGFITQRWLLSGWGVRLPGSSLAVAGNASDLSIHLFKCISCSKQ